MFFCLSALFICALITYWQPAFAQSSASEYMSNCARLRLPWCGKIVKDSMTDEVSRIIYGTNGSETFSIIKKQGVDCLLAKLEIRFAVLDYKKAPMYRVDDFKAIDVSATAIKEHSPKSYVWALADCNKKNEEKIIIQFLKGEELKFRCYLFPDGIDQIQFKLGYHFMHAYAWFTNKTLGDVIQFRDKE
jgi:hypothetical protein